VVAHIRFRGGATQTMRLPLTLTAPELHKTHSSLGAEIDRLLDHDTDTEIADIPTPKACGPAGFTEEGERSGALETLWATNALALVCYALDLGVDTR
jgi:hypothetical protein